MLFCVVNVCSAQFQTGKKVIGGQFGLSGIRSNVSTSSSDYQRSGSLSASLSLSRFKSPLTLNGFGFSYGYNYSRSKTSNPINEQFYRAHYIGANISSTKFKPLARKLFLSFTGSAGVGFSYAKTYNSKSSDYSKNNYYNIGISGNMGLLYQLNERFLLDITISNLLRLSYNYGILSSYSGATITKLRNSSYNLSTGLTGFGLTNLSIGVKYILK